MKLDRALQLTILQTLRDVHPHSNRTLISEFAGEREEDERLVLGNLIYLDEHGLVESGVTRVGRDGYTFRGATITAKGLDFLENDGGLSAILGVVTIRLHDDTIKSLLEKKIIESALPSPEKKRYLDQLRELPAETTKHLVLKLVDLGLEKGPAAIAAIGTLLFP